MQKPPSDAMTFAEGVVVPESVGLDELEAAGERVLGRDPDQIRPFALSWGPLIDLLDRNGITITEDELIATPFVFEFSDTLLAELEANATG